MYEKIVQKYGELEKWAEINYPADKYTIEHEWNTLAQRIEVVVSVNNNGKMKQYATYFSREILNNSKEMESRLSIIIPQMERARDVQDMQETAR